MCCLARLFHPSLQSPASPCPARLSPPQQEAAAGGTLPGSFSRQCRSHGSAPGSVLAGWKVVQALAVTFADLRSGVILAGRF